MTKLTYKPTVAFLKKYTTFKTIKSFIEKAAEYETYFTNELILSEKSDDFFIKYTSFKNADEYCDTLVEKPNNVFNLLTGLHWVFAEETSQISATCYCMNCGKEKTLKLGEEITLCECGHKSFRLEKDFPSYQEANDRLLNRFKKNKS